jgi:hypothetical protein
MVSSGISSPAAFRLFTLISGFATSGFIGYFTGYLTGCLVAVRVFAGELEVDFVTVTGSLEVIVAVGAEPELNLLPGL